MYLVSHSHPVWLCDPVCGLIPSGSGPGSGQQPVWDSGWCLENHHSVSPHRPRESPGYRGLAAHSSRHRYIGCCNKRKSLFKLNVPFLLKLLQRHMPETIKMTINFLLSLHVPGVLVSQQAMIIAFTSDMIPRLVYYWSFSVYPYGNQSNYTMEGYINSSLSIFNIKDFSNQSQPLSTPDNITTCRYKDWPICVCFKCLLLFIELINGL